MNYLFTNILGSFVLNENIAIIDKILFKDLDEHYKKEAVERKLKKKFPKIQALPNDKLNAVLALFKDKQYYPNFYTRNVILTRRGVKNSVTEDQLIIQAIANINELDKISNLLVKRLREWYSLYLPELSEKVSHHEKFVELVLEKKRSDIFTDLHITEEDTMGKNLEKNDTDEIKLVAERVTELYSLRKKHEDYLTIVMQKYCPNILALAGTTIGARLLEISRGLKRMAMLPSSTIQLLGAEKALFRHIKTGSRSPKYGVIFSHPLIQKAKAKERGKVSRALADKLSLCARLDYFKGDMKGMEYKKKLEDKFK